MIAALRLLHCCIVPLMRLLPHFATRYYVAIGKFRGGPHVCLPVSASQAWEIHGQKRGCVVRVLYFHFLGFGMCCRIGWL